MEKIRVIIQSRSQDQRDEEQAMFHSLGNAQDIRENEALDHPIYSLCYEMLMWGCEVNLVT